MQPPEVKVLMTRRLLASFVLLLLALGTLWAQEVERTALGQSLLGDLRAAQDCLEKGQSPWPDRTSRPQAGPVAALRASLPGNGIWEAFKPVDCAIREAYHQQRSIYLEKDAGLIERRAARTELEPLRDAIKTERRCYSNATVGTALRQLDQVDYALRHLQYHAALCVMWSMADALGLWDRQAALESAERHLGAARERGLRRQQLSSGEAKHLTQRLDTITCMIQTAVAWKPAPEAIGPSEVDLMVGSYGRNDRHFAEPYDPGGAFDSWRETRPEQTGASPWLHVQPWTRDDLERPAPETRCLAPCPRRYRDWQYTLNDYRYGWLVYTHSAAGNWKPGCDWRELQPKATWPAGRGAQNAGGL